MKLFGKIVFRGSGATAPVATANLARDKRGNVVAIVAASMPVMVGAMGLGVDFSQWVLWKRNLQGAADTAAFSAAQVLQAGAATSVVQAEATKVINHNNSTAFIPRTLTQITRIASPGQILAAGQTGATHGTSVQVVLEAEGPLYFAGLFLTDRPTIRTRAVAGPRGAGEKCFMSLSPTAEKALWLVGSPVVSASCGFMSNSNHTNSLYLEGSASLSANSAQAVGGVNKEGSSNWNSTVRTPNVPAMADPFGTSGRNLQEPTCSTWLNVTSGSGGTNFWHKDNTNPHTSQPGCYNVPGGGVVLFDGNGKLKLAPGVYVFRRSGSGEAILKIDGNIDVSGTGVSFVLMDGVRLEVNGNIKFNVSAMTSEKANELYGSSGTIANDANRKALAGVLFWQTDPSYPTDKNNFITGNSNVVMKGAIYSPHQGFEFKGNMGSSDCLQLVALTIKIEGNSSVTNNCPANDPNFQNFGEAIRIVLAE